ncbi:transcriptional regulator [Corynebacterium suranareeae]|uniref:Transcriptional regulator n=1 Tax=Corynebacterium suranareeae TaxID=2506452 RepID=A0A160PPI5_9CORY|nr:hypothetical protein [Corynebacterium suranareeae]BAU95354.1 transcriptional regulator [Corynebacterium suranareeae]
MKKLRLATIAAATVALTAGLTPSASAQDFNQIIDTFDCGLLGAAIYNTGLAHENSTRAELAANLRNSTAVSQLDFPLNVAAVSYSERIANRALTCGLVKEDPQDFLTQLQQFSSNLSSSFMTA